MSAVEIVRFGVEMVSSGVEARRSGLSHKRGCFENDRAESGWTAPKLVGQLLDRNVVKLPFPLGAISQKAGAPICAYALTSAK